MSSEDDPDWDFGPIRNWVEQAMKADDVKWQSLFKWIDKCEAKFNELQSTVDDQEDKLLMMDDQLEDAKWSQGEHDHLVEDLLDIQRGIMTLPEMMDELDGTGWRFGHLANGKDNPAYLPRVRPRKEEAC